MSNRNYSLEVTDKKQGHVIVKQKAALDGSCVLIVTLYGHTVFSAHYGKRTISFNMCGYYTASTRDVINTALREFRPDMKVFKQANIWRCSFANGEEESHLEACEGKHYGFGDAS